MNLPPLPPQFIAYKLEWDAAKEKWQKVPCDVSGRNISPTDPANFRSADQVLPHCTWDHTQVGRPYGLAWALTANDNWFFLDIDDGMGADGQWKPDAAQHFEAFPGAWGEVSVSGTGLHIVGICQPHLLADKRNKFYENKREFYIKDRFIAFGPNGWQRIGGVTEDYDHTATLVSWVPDRPPEEAWDGNVDERYTGPADDDELIALMMKSKASAGAEFGDKVTIQQLWEGDEATLCRFFPDVSGRPGKMDRSSADLALMNRLAFWTGKDRARMERLFRRSGLMRDKFDKRADYRVNTINDAASACQIVYDFVRPDQKQNVSEGLASGRIMDVATQYQHFAGCYYIANLHKVLLPDGRLMKPEQFNALYGGHEFMMDLENKTVSKKAFECFTESRAIRFPKHAGTCFNPGQEFGWVDEWDNVNTYIPARRKPIPGDVSPMLRLLEALFPTQQDLDIFMHWQAHNVQNPHIAPKWSPVLQGVEGCGKGIIGEAFAHAMGKEHTHWPKAETVSEKYNGWIVGNTTAIVNEAHTNDRFEVLNVIKPLITDEDQEVRPMGGEKYMTRVYLRFLFTTNHEDAIPKTKNDRRFAIVYLTAQDDEDLVRLGLTEDFFRYFIDWRDKGGFDMWTHYLLGLEVAPLPIRAPKTSSHDAAIAQSRGPIAQLIHEAIEQELPGFRGGYLSTVRLNEYLKQEGKRLAPRSLGKVIKECGYEGLGKSSICIFEEDNKRPRVYIKKGMSKHVSPNDYMTAQGYQEHGNMGVWITTS